ncbi:hypothetical protein PAPHI01_2362 [Pancytospora philotis]|nr:hypothetical protein PAPHI01_2362 [Pancytospora philotis]
MQILSTYDALKLTIISTVGSAVLVAPQMFAVGLSSPYLSLGLLAAAGALTLVQALCYAELARIIPGGGGDAAYMEKAFSHKIGMFYNLFSCWAILPASAAFCVSKVVEILGGSPYLVAVCVIVPVILVFFLPGRGKESVLDLFFYMKLVCIGLLAVAICASLGSDGKGWMRSGSAAATPVHAAITAFVNCTYFFSGYNTCNYMQAPGSLRGAYVLSVLAVTCVYFLITAAQFSIFSRDELAGDAILCVLLMHALGPLVPTGVLGGAATAVEMLIESVMYLGPVLGCVAVYEGIVRASVTLKNKELQRLLHAGSYVLFGVKIYIIVITKTSLSILNLASILIALFYCLTFVGLLKLRSSVTDPIHVLIPLSALLVSAGIVSFNIYQKLFG